MTGSSGSGESIVARLSSALADRYRIERELGAGGMATVYLAEDLRHDRKVALKVLRPELAAVIGAQRFLAEIKTTANLQHPHILPLHDSGEVNGTVFYVMPFVEGDSLRDRLNAEKQLPVPEAVRIASEVASALDYAHRHNVIHRDIKPENILLHDGRAMVADFGIALAASKSEGTTRLTETGMSLGTPHYMSPEQAMGERDIDGRADLYALGCVLYEMLAGEPPFTGPTVQSIVAKVLSSEPEPLTTYRKTTPPNVAAAVVTALQRLPADRYATAAKFAEALADARATTAVPGVAPARAGRQKVLVAGLATVAAASAAVAVWALTRPAPSAPVIRYGLALPPSQAPDPIRNAIPSPDGSRIAYVGSAEGSALSQVWIKERNERAARPLPGSLGVTYFTFSPDGKWIGVLAGGSLLKLPLTGGSGITLASQGASGRAALAWLDDGTLVFARTFRNELARVPEAGGEATTIWSDRTMAVEHVSPLPGARGILFQACEAPCSDPDVFALDLSSGSTKVVVPGGLAAFYLPTGHLAYVRDDGAMLGEPFDLGALEARGDPVPLVDSIAIVGTLPLVSISRSGTLVVRTGASLESREFELVWVDQSGRVGVVDSTEEPFRLTAYAGNHGWALSPDGTQLVIGTAGPTGDDIWWKRLPRGPRSRVSSDGGSEYRPRWTPDGRYVLFNSDRSVHGLYRRRADGSGADSLLVAGDYDEGAISPDEKWYIFRSRAASAGAGGRDILAMQLGVDSVPRPLLEEPYDEHSFAISPNGRIIAYQSDENGRGDVFVRPFPNVDSGKRQVSVGGGAAPLWSRDGRVLYYVTPGHDMMEASVTAGSTLQVGEPRMLFHLADNLLMASFDYYTPWDITPDGRFIMVRSIGSPSQLDAPLVVVENWFEEVKEKMRGR